MKWDSFYRQIDLGILSLLPFDPWQVDTPKIVTLKNGWVQIHLGGWFIVCRSKDSARGVGLWGKGTVNSNSQGWWFCVLLIILPGGLLITLDQVVSVSGKRRGGQAQDEEMWCLWALAKSHWFSRLFWWKKTTACSVTKFALVNFIFSCCFFSFCFWSFSEYG